MRRARSEFRPLLLAAWLGVAGCAPGATGKAGPAPDEWSRVRVAHVIDGDTLVAERDDGTRTRVRLLGIDTPELGRDGEADEPWAREARDLARRLVEGREVTLLRDPQVRDRDDYGRLLRHVRLLEGRLLEEELLRAGYAEVYERARFERKALFRRLERQARTAGIGIWSASGEKGRGRE